MGTQRSKCAPEPGLLSWRWLLSQAPTGAISEYGRGVSMVAAPRGCSKASGGDKGRRDLSSLS